MRKQGVFSVMFIVGILASILSLPAKSNAEASPWLSPTDPQLEKLSETNSPLPFWIEGNRECKQTKVITLRIHETSHQSCFVNTAYGDVSTSGYLRLPATYTWGTMTNQYGGYLKLVPAPRTTTLVALDGGSYAGMYVNFVRNFDGHFIPRTLSGNFLDYQLPPSSNIELLRDKSGRPITIDYSSISFSPDGTWMVADSPIVGTLRINLATLEVLPFATPLNYFAGSAPALKTAVTSDGRYAIVASKSFAVFKLYDLNTCGVVPERISGPVICSSRDLLPFARNNIENLSDLVTNIRFTGNYSFTFYTSYRDSSGLTHTRNYLLTASGQEPTHFEYLALGDSYASGEGAFNYKVSTDLPTKNTCHVSYISYSYLLAQSLGLNQSESVACSGAKIKDIIPTISDKIYNEKQRQSYGFEYLDPSDEIYDNYLPGYRTQVGFVDRKRPSVITISTVGNDIGFADIIKRCLALDTCYSKYDERYQLMQEINSQFDRLVNMYDELKKNGDPKAKIYVLGYPEVADSNGNCAANVRLDKQELDFANKLVDYLDGMIEGATKKAGVEYIDVSKAMHGHRLCETYSWDVAINGFTAGNDAIVPYFGPFGNESFHPNSLGHRLYRDTILSATNNFTVSMPQPDETASPPVINNSQPLLEGFSENNADTLATLTFFSSDLAKDTTASGDNITLSADGFSLKPNTTFRAEIHSTPQILGTAKTDGYGNFSSAFVIPDNLETGFHTIHLLGQNIAGEQVDIYKALYVDNTHLPTELCPGDDTDKDAVPDSCDPLISELPAPPAIIIVPDPAPIEPTAPVQETNEPEIPSSSQNTNPIDLQPASDPEEIVTPSEPPTTEPDNLPVIDSEPVPIESEDPQPPQTVIEESGNSVDPKLHMSESSPWATYTDPKPAPAPVSTPAATPTQPLPSSTTTPAPTQEENSTPAAEVLGSSTTMPKAEDPLKDIPTEPQKQSGYITYLVVGFGLFIIVLIFLAIKMLTPRA